MNVVTSPIYFARQQLPKIFLKKHTNLKFVNKILWLKLLSKQGGICSIKYGTKKMMLETAAGSSYDLSQFINN